MQEFTKKLASYVFDMPVILDKYFQLQKLGLLGKPSFCSFSQCYQTLLDLFFFRSKIVKAFQDSRIIYQNIATAYDEIEKIIEEIKSITESEQITTKILNQLTNKLK